MKNFIDLLPRFLELCQEESLILSGDCLLAAVSGGPDSITMLDLLHRWRQAHSDIELHVAHFNHQLREQAEDDQRFVEELCLRLDIPFYSTKSDVSAWADEHELSIHAAARDLRYRFLIETAKGFINKARDEVKIITGHHENDQAETVLMRLFASASLEGLAGIRKSAEWEKGIRIVRPLLNFNRTNIEGYCRWRGLKFLQDESNFDPAYPRTVIRHKILPYIKDQFGEKALRNIARSAEMIEEFADFYSKEIENAFNKDFRQVGLGEIALDYNIFISYLNMMRTAVLQRAFRAVAGANHRISRERLKAVDHHIINSGQGAIELSAGVSVECFNGLIYLWREQRWDHEMTLVAGETVMIPGFGLLSARTVNIEKCILPPPNDSQYCDYNSIGPGPYKIRPACQGDRIRPLRGESDYKVSDILRENRIPPHRRRYPLILCGKSIAVIPPFRISDKFRLTKSTRRAVKFTLAVDDQPTLPIDAET